MDEYLLLVSADDRTLLMFAAQSSDPSTFIECAAVLRRTVKPRDVSLFSVHVRVTRCVPPVQPRAVHDVLWNWNSLPKLGELGLQDVVL